MANEQRPGRETETREATSRTENWTPPSVLPEIQLEKGWVGRWIRTATLGLDDKTNVSVRFREGWIPVKASEVTGSFIKTDQNSQFKDNIEVGGLLFCKMSEEDAKRRQRYYEEQSQAQREAVDNNYMRESDPRMPVLKPERSTRVAFGRGARRT